MSVTLRKRKNADGSTSFRLDIYHNGQRTIETLKNIKLVKPSDLKDREHNKALQQQAEAIRVTRMAELEADNYNMVSDAGKKVVVTSWMQAYVDNYNKKDKRNMQGALNRFAEFLIQLRKNNLNFGNLNAVIIEDFIEYLEARSKGEGASSYYSRFKKMIKQAYRQRLIKDNILDFVERKVKGKAKKKDTLTLEEIKTLSCTSIESTQTKSAFLFCCVTGLRWGDVKSLKWQHINIAERQMKVYQWKTGETVIIGLNTKAMELLGEQGNMDKNVFDLPSANGANKTLKAWVRRANINKEITWHNARHSSGTNLIYSDIDVLTASKLLGHTSMKHTQRYVNASEEMKRRATDKLNF